jgi:hypothetical protein
MILLILTNMPWTQWFLGWDSINPELNPWLNVRRAFFSSWQENYGVGTVTGHGFAGTLPHSLIAGFLSLLLPEHLVRSVFTFLCLYAGGFGVYTLLRLLLGDRKDAEFASTVGALFYVLNLATIQIFAIQLDAFAGHFATLPWVFWALTACLTRSYRRDWLFLVVTLFLSTFQAFIPSVFLAFGAAWGIFLLVYLIAHRFRPASIGKVAAVAALTLAVNAYWLFPILYYQQAGNATFLNSYNNMISTDDFIEKNRKYGDSQDMALLRGFYWDLEKDDVPVFAPWIEHQRNPIVLALGYATFAGVAIGVGVALLKLLRWTWVAFAGVLLFFFTSLATAFPPFSYITELLQIIPTYRQAFRSGFTKLSIGTAFGYAIFLAVGVLAALWLLERKRAGKRMMVVARGAIIAGLLLYALPAFTGNLLYRNLKLDLPSSYREVIDFFGTQPNGRIADFPQDCSEGWYGYNWGYFGSGFYWYGIEQPFMSRSFDVWNAGNESYYWEITQALRAQDMSAVDSVLAKYDVKWVLYDPNFQHCRDNRAFAHHLAFLDHVANSDRYTLARTFEAAGRETIKVYEFEGSSAESFVEIRTGLPNILPETKWTDDDVAYRENGAYISDESRPADVYYPFRRLFTKRSADENPVSIDRDAGSITFETRVSSAATGSRLSVPGFADSGGYMPVRVGLSETTARSLEVTLAYVPAEIALDGVPVWSPPAALALGTITATDTASLTVEIASVAASLRDDGETPGVGATGVFRPGSPDNTVRITRRGTSTPLLSWSESATATAVAVLNRPLDIPVPNGAFTLTVTVPAIEDHPAYGQTFSAGDTLPVPCHQTTPSNRNRFEVAGTGEEPFVRMISRDSKQCIIRSLDAPPTDVAYAVGIRSRGVSGGDPLFYATNHRKILYHFGYLNNDASPHDHLFVLPPVFPGERGYEFYVENYSLNDFPSVNDYYGMWYSAIPLRYLTGMRVEGITETAERGEDGRSPIADESPVTVRVEHPNETGYVISGIPASATHAPMHRLVLRQGFDPGWAAYVIDEKNPLQRVFPFLGGLQLDGHARTDGWANSWELTATSRVASRAENGSYTVTILFIPQYMQFIGYTLLLGGFIGTGGYFILRRTYTKLPERVHTT